MHVSSLLLSWIITALSLPSLFSPSPLIYYIFLLSWCLAGGSFLCWNANASDPAHTSKSFSCFSYLAGLDAAKIKQVGTICGQESTRRIGDYKVKYGYSDIELLRWGKGFCPRLLHWREILPFLLTSLFIANVTFFFLKCCKIQTYHSRAWNPWRVPIRRSDRFSCSDVRRALQSSGSSSWPWASQSGKNSKAF